MKLTAPLAGALFVVALAGCSGGEVEAAPTATVTATVTAEATVTATTTVTASPTPAETATAEAAAPGAVVGETVQLDEIATVSVYEYATNVAPEAPSPGEGLRWDGADVEVCILDGAPDQYTVNTLPWSLIGDDSGRYDSSSTGYRQFPEPGYPSGDEPILPGECLRGWIVFDVSADATIASVRYSLSSTGDVLSWDV